MFFDEVYKYFVGTFIIGCGFFISFKLVDKFVYQPMLADGEDDCELSEDEIRERSINDYSISYLEDYSNLESVKLSKNDFDKLLRCFLIEDTPLGIVKMYYSNEDESFIYWSEKQVPYKILETVSRKYVIDYNCKSVHIGMDEELDKQRKLLMDMKNECEDKTTGDSAEKSDAEGKHDDKAESEPTKTSVFANFKKYNTGGSKTTTTKVGNKTKTKNVIVCDRANRYSYRGVYDSTKNIMNKFNDATDDTENDNLPKKMSVSAFLKQKKEYHSRYDENSNYDNDDSDTTTQADDKAADGFWRFLNINYVANDLSNNTVCKPSTEVDTEVDKGAFWINGKRYSSRQAYHSAVTEMNTSAGSGDKDSDNSYDVLECETKNDDNVTIPDSESEGEGECAEKNGNDDDVVESGVRQRTNSVASDVSNNSAKSSWLGW